MKIEFKCENCGQPLAIDEENSGEEAQCPKCGMEFSIPPSTSSTATAPTQAVDKKPPEEMQEKATKAALIGNGAAGGAIFGAMAFVVFFLIDRFFFGGSESARHGLIVSLVMGAIFGAGWGAIVGIATVMARSTGAGIATGAVLFALVKVFAMRAVGLGGGWSVLGFVIGLVYGGIFGAIVAQSVMRSIKWDKV